MLTAPDSPAPPTEREALPERYNLVVPRSACPHCGAPILVHQNVPVISWLLLGGKCARCKAKISPRYPIVELATALLSAAVVWRFGFHWQSVAALFVTWALVALTVIDLDHQILPDVITLPLLWLGLLASVAWHPGLIPPIPTDPVSAILGAAAGYLSLWSVYWAFKLLTGKEGMGYGDFKLFGALGAWMGWQMLPLILLLSAFTGAAVGIALIVARGRDRNIPIPFGPYLAAAGWIALMWGPQIVGGYLSLTGLGR
jgi:leader peptidase (prepilin peptidase)/N-methyltransferase